MSAEELIAAIQGSSLTDEDLQDVAIAALIALFDRGSIDEAATVEELDGGTGGRFTRYAVEDYTQNESIHGLIRLLVSRSQPGRVSDLVHEITLHHWKQDGVAEVLQTFEAIKRDIRQQERMGLSLTS